MRISQQQNILSCAEGFETLHTCKRFEASFNVRKMGEMQLASASLVTRVDAVCQHGLKSVCTNQHGTMVHMRKVRRPHGQMIELRCRGRIAGGETPRDAAGPQQ